MCIIARVRDSTTTAPQRAHGYRKLRDPMPVVISRGAMEPRTSDIGHPSKEARDGAVIQDFRSLLNFFQPWMTSRNGLA